MSTQQAAVSTRNIETPSGRISYNESAQAQQRYLSMAS
jgi:hypothetical protein